MCAVCRQGKRVRVCQRASKETAEPYTAKMLNESAAHHCDVEYLFRLCATATHALRSLFCLFFFLFFSLSSHSHTTFTWCVRAVQPSHSRHANRLNFWCKCEPNGQTPSTDIVHFWLSACVCVCVRVPSTSEEHIRFEQTTTTTIHLKLTTCRKYYVEIELYGVKHQSPSHMLTPFSVLVNRE